jgi:hypothetical protein
MAEETKKDNPEFIIATAPSEYVCPKHGKIPAGQVVTIKNLGPSDGEYCGVCHAENLAKITPRVRPYEKPLF